MVFNVDWKGGDITRVITHLIESQFIKTRKEGVQWKGNVFFGLEKLP
jgi:hypothetical protein